MVYEYIIKLRKCILYVCIHFSYGLKLYTMCYTDIGSYLCSTGEIKKKKLEHNGRRITVCFHTFKVYLFGMQCS